MEYPEASGGREAVPDERAGGAQEIREVRAGGAQEIREVRAGEARENAAVLEKLEKNGALQHSPERAELLIILLKSPVDGGQGYTSPVDGGQGCT